MPQNPKTLLELINNINDYDNKGEAILKEFLQVLFKLSATSLHVCNGCK